MDNSLSPESAVARQRFDSQVLIQKLSSCDPGNLGKKTHTIPDRSAQLHSTGSCFVALTVTKVMQHQFFVNTDNLQYLGTGNGGGEWGGRWWGTFPAGCLMTKNSSWSTRSWGFHSSVPQLLYWTTETLGKKRGCSMGAPTPHPKNQQELSIIFTIYL